MNSRIKYYIFTGMLAIISSMAFSQDERPTNSLGIHVGGGFSNLLLGQSSDPTHTSVNPSLGGGGLAGLSYEFEYKHFLLQTGLGFGYTFNNNHFQIPDMTANIVEYPTMQYHYTFDKFNETTTYGIGYIPILLGASFKQWYFLAGAKLGLMPFANTTQPKMDVTVWATDEDIIGSLVDLPNHGLQSYHYEGKQKSIDVEPFNAMLSAEIGIKLNKSAWMPEPKKKMDRAERYREARRKKTLKELTHYRLSLFADYGLSNLHSYSANPVAYGGQENGGLIAQNGLTSLTPYSMLGYEPYSQSPLSNLMVGVKLSVQFELPKKAPTKGAMALPYIYIYVQDDMTEKPLPNARVQIQQEGVSKSSKSSKSIYDKYTDTKFGRVGKAFAPGKYWAYVSHKKYCNLDTIHFEHRDDYDTLRVALHPLKQLCWSVENAITNQPMTAQLEIKTTSGKQVLKSLTDSTFRVCAMLDDRQSYIITAHADGFEEYTSAISINQEDNRILLMPLPKKTFVLQNMHFATAQTTILPSSQRALDLLYELLDENPNLYIRIVGHTDDVGSEQDNKLLSEGRANSIQLEMVKRGIASKRIQTMGKGELEPLVPNTSEANRQKNRRVEIEIISGDDDVNIERLAH